MKSCLPFLFSTTSNVTSLLLVLSINHNQVLQPSNSKHSRYEFSYCTSTSYRQWIHFCCFITSCFLQTRQQEARWILYGGRTDENLTLQPTTDRSRQEYLVSSSLHCFGFEDTGTSTSTSTSTCTVGSTYRSIYDEVFWSFPMQSDTSNVGLI